MTGSRGLKVMSEKTELAVVRRMFKMVERFQITSTKLCQTKSVEKAIYIVNDHKR